ncbi:MAG: alpha/beta family hydrolase [Dermatophilaceae bacterium]
MSATVLALPTPHGPARAHVHRPRGATGLVMLGHGAGPSITTVDLLAARDAVIDAGWAAAVVEQPWLVAGGRVASPPAVLDACWLAVVRRLRGRGGALHSVRGPLVLAGRSAGARVACRTATALRADAVLCLSFPLHPPGKPQQLRSDELVLPGRAGLPVLVVQGQRDPFGTPAEVTAYVPGVYAVPGTHTIPRTSGPAVGQAVREFVTQLGE